MDTPDITKEKSSTENTVTLLMMRLNQSLAQLDALNKFPESSKPHNIKLFRSVYQDVFELSRLTRATLSESLLSELKKWQTSNTVRNTKFTENAIYLTEKIYDELSESGMIDIRVRKTAAFPMEFYLNRIQS